MAQESSRFDSLAGASYDETVFLPTFSAEDANLHGLFNLSSARIEQVGKLHSFHYFVNGVKFGGKLDVPAFTPLSYQQPGMPSGTLSDKITHVSKIYDGMKSDYWVYVPAQYQPETPAAVMVFQDGGGYMDRNG